MTCRSFVLPPAPPRFGHYIHIRSRLVGFSRASLWSAAMLVITLAACQPSVYMETGVVAQELHSTGIIGETCDALGPSDGLRLSISLADDFGRPVPASASGEGDAIMLSGAGGLLRPVDLKVVGGDARLFPASDVPCTEAQIGDVCPDEELAAVGFVCHRLLGESGTDRTCRRTSPCADGWRCVEAACVADPPACALSGFPLVASSDAPIELEGRSERAQSVILLVAGGGSVLGVRDDGVPSATDCSSDPEDLRVRGALDLLHRLSRAPTGVETRTELCVAAFGGGPEPDYATSRESACFRSAHVGGAGEEVWERRIRQLGQDETPGGRSPWEAVEDASRRLHAFGGDGDRHIVLVTDGGTSADVRHARASSEAHRIARAFTEAQQADVTVHVIQYGRPGAESGCRYSAAAVPEGELARIACATGRSYKFVASPEDLPAHFDGVGRAIHGRYTLRLDAPTISELPLGSYKAEFVFTGSIGKVQLTVSFGSASGSLPRDTRASVVIRGDCVERPCLAGLQCSQSDGQCREPTDEPDGG